MIIYKCGGGFIGMESQKPERKAALGHIMTILMSF